jgi:hypothetical protein
MWFANCQCLVTSSTCLGGNKWNSVAIEDIMVASPAVVQTDVADPAGSALIKNTDTQTTVAPVAMASAPIEPECDTSSSDLMQYFQSKCTMSQNMWLTRLVALAIVGGVFLIVISSFGVAYYFDKEEAAKAAL